MSLTISGKGMYAFLLTLCSIPQFLSCKAMQGSQSGPGLKESYQVDLIVAGLNHIP